MQEPFNAEPHRSGLISSYVTPVDLFYKRNHGPIPVVDDIERLSVLSNCLHFSVILLYWCSCIWSVDIVFLLWVWSISKGSSQWKIFGKQGSWNLPNYLSIYVVLYCQLSWLAASLQRHIFSCSCIHICDLLQGYPWSLTAPLPSLQYTVLCSGNDPHCFCFLW